MFKKTLKRFCTHFKTPHDPNSDENSDKEYGTDEEWFRVEDLKNQIKHTHKFQGTEQGKQHRHLLKKKLLAATNALKEARVECNAKKPKILDDIYVSDFKKQEKDQVVRDLVREKIIATYSFHPGDCSEDVVRVYACEPGQEKPEYYEKMRQSLVAVISAILDLEGEHGGNLFDAMENYLTRTNSGGLAYEETSAVFHKKVLGPFLENSAEQHDPMEIPFLKPIGQKRSDIYVYVKKRTGVVVRVASYFMTDASLCAQKLEGTTKTFTYFKTITETVITPDGLCVDENGAKVFRIGAQNRLLIFSQEHPFWK